MPDTVPHLGVLDRYYDPFRFIENVSVLPCAGRKADVTGLRLDGLTVGVGFEVARVVGGAFLLVTDLVAVRIIHFSFHVTPHIDGLPNAATPSKSYSA